MLKSRFLRRSLLTLVVSAAPGIASTTALYADVGGRPASAALRRASQSTALRQTPADSKQADTAQGAVRQVQHQTSAPQPAAGNNAVLQELNKLFRENGQEMPPMESHKLPYATTPRMDTVRAKPVSEKKPGILNKIFGRFRKDSAEPEASDTATSATTPPPIVMPNAAQGQGFRQPVPGNVQPRTAQNVPPARPHSAPPAGNVVRQQVSAPPAANQGARPRTAVPAGVYQPAGQPNTVETASQQVRPVSAAPKSTPETVQALPETEDGFVNPFRDPAPAEEEVMLDLDSLIENTVEPDVVAAPAEAPVPDQTEVAEQDPFSDEPAEAAVPVENPFTGVTLDMGDEAFFGSSSEQPAETETPAVASEAVTEQQSANPFQLAEPPQPMEDFGGNLPSFDISESDSSAFQEEPAFEEQAVQLTPVESENTLQKTAELPPAEPAVEDNPFRMPEQSGSNQQARQSGRVVQQQKPVQAEAQPKTRITANNAELIRQQQQRIRREVQRELIASRSGQPGFKGFCPVVLRDQRELLDSSEQYTATFGLRTYQFSSAQALATFEADPSRYAPAAGGSDVVLLINTGEEQEGTLDFALWYRDRLYLFRSRQTMALFSQNPQHYANQY